MNKICSICHNSICISFFSKNKRVIDGFSSFCKSCRSNYYRNNKERKYKNQKEWRAKNPNWDNKWRKTHVDSARNSVRKWEKNHPEYVAQKNIKRDQKRSQRIPSWLSTKEINNILQFYKNCPKGYHVDHIIPLCGKIVSGLHVLNNLQYLTPKENLIKSNSFKVKV